MVIMEPVDCDDRVLLKLKQKVLQEKWNTLCDQLEAQKHFPWLRGKVFTKSDEEQIMNEVTSVGRNSEFLDRLTKRKNAYDILIEALKKLGPIQDFIVEDLETCLQETIAREASAYSGVVSSMDQIDEDEDMSMLPSPHVPSYMGPPIPDKAPQFPRPGSTHV